VKRGVESAPILDKDLQSQLQHCKEQLERIRYCSLKVAWQEGSDDVVLLTSKAMGIAYDVASKLRMILDQALMRVM
jgi:hypothetical protein